MRMIRAYILASILGLLSTVSFGQDSSGIQRLPVIEHNKLYSDCNSIQITMLASGQSFTFSGNNAQYMVMSIDTLAPDSIVKADDAYLMFLNNGKEIMDGFMSYGRNDEFYFKFKIDGRTFYNRLRQEGVSFFQQQR